MSELIEFLKISGIAAAALLIICTLCFLIFGPAGLIIGFLLTLILAWTAGYRGWLDGWLL